MLVNEYKPEFQFRKSPKNAEFRQFPFLRARPLKLLKKGPALQLHWPLQSCFKIMTTYILYFVVTPRNFIMTTCSAIADFSITGNKHTNTSC